MTRTASTFVLVLLTAAGVAGQTGGTIKPAPPATGKPAAPATAQPASPAVRSPGAGPIIVFETVKGTFEVETYPAESPKSVAHILTLVKRNFYNGLRMHRVIPGFVAQFGDPLTRDMTRRKEWGTRGSGKEVGVAEISPKRIHKLGAVAMAHRGDPRGVDSQLYICLSGPGRYESLNGDYPVIGQVISGMDVVQKLQEPDLIRRATIR